MNSKYIIGLIGSFIAGAACGIAGTYLYMKKSYCDKKIDEGIADYILHKYDAEDDAEDDVEDVSDDDTDNGISSGKIDATTVPKYQTPTEERVPYNEFYDKKPPQDILAEREHPVDSDEDDDDNEVLDEMGESEREAYLDGLSTSMEHEAYLRGELSAIEIITEDEYGKRPDYDDDVLVYWLGDDILTTELEEVVLEELSDSLMDAFTDEWIKKAEADVDSDDARLFIRNHEFMKDYMILPDIRAYWEHH